MDKTGEDWDGLNLGKFEKRRPTLFQIYISLYQNVIYKDGKSFSVVMLLDRAPVAQLVEHGLSRGRSWVQLPAGPTLRVFK